MGLKMKVKTYSFWVSLASAVILIVKLLGQKFGFKVDEGLISDLFTSLCGLLVIMGIIVVPSPAQLEYEEKHKSSKEIDGVTEQIQIDEKLNALCESKKSDLCDQSNDRNFINAQLVDETQNEKEKDNENIVLENEQDNQNFCNNCNNENDLLTDGLCAKEDSQIDYRKKIDSFLEKVYVERTKLNGDINNFAEFLQNEILNIKKEDN